ncbi:FAD-dependent oxidoreductase [Modestobacter sp. VKM Ac-2983]|uniref:NAD(P)/FAD-dependent oxidoreductase n=1 Tax=Modestobacter sp. VKM Ac-2983 TaxID=3004137 RepID=UPI0022AB6693|nr:FAD-dependent oxidoreductase [Modestobacter sp. VKM Ac-2983]MCZ2804013.1 FAD-dependent oxidoreductase [Modestobacter sp. VKM Ac-2983]
MNTAGTTTVVGGGIAGIACARALADRGLPVQVLDRGRRLGGRMGGRSLHGRAVDLGASYFTVGEDDGFARVVAGWVDRGLARPWTDTFAVAGPDGIERTTSGPLRYGTAGGLRGLVVDLAEGLDVQLDRAVTHVGDGGSPTVDGDPAAAVVLAMPDPQAARLLDPGAAVAGSLQDAGWQPTLAVAIGFPERGWPADLHGVFVHDSPVLDWVADDGDRRGDGAPVLVAHTTPAFAAENLAEPERAAPAVLAAVRALLGLSGEPEWTHVHRWTFAKPTAPRDAPFALADGIGLCGDGWAAPSKVESAWRSGDALGSALADATA